MKASGSPTRSPCRVPKRRPRSSRSVRSTKVFKENGEEVVPGSGDVGLLAVGGNIPVGYYKDEAKSAATFQTINGSRWSVPGDFASVEADGTIVLLGRGSVVINSGGEKIYPEEVEEASSATRRSPTASWSACPTIASGRRSPWSSPWAPGAEATGEEIGSCARGAGRASSIRAIRRRSPRCCARRTARPTTSGPRASPPTAWAERAVPHAQGTAHRAVPPRTAARCAYFAKTTSSTCRRSRPWRARHGR